MTTTKEDQIRAGYKKWLDDNYLIEFPTDTSHPNQISYPFEAYKACAESYEKKLAEKEEIITALQMGWNECIEQRSEDNARNARLVDGIKRGMEDVREGQCNDALSTLNETITANSEAELKINGKE